VSKGKKRKKKKEKNKKRKKEKNLSTTICAAILVWSAVCTSVKRKKGMWLKRPTTQAKEPYECG